MGAIPFSHQTFDKINNVWILCPGTKSSRSSLHQQTLISQDSLMNGHLLPTALSSDLNPLICQTLTATHLHKRQSQTRHKHR